MFDGKSILITGGTGSFGHGFVDTLLKRYKPRRDTKHCQAAKSRPILAAIESSWVCRVLRAERGSVGEVVCFGDSIDSASIRELYGAGTVKWAVLR